MSEQKPGRGKEILNRLGILGELLQFFWQRKVYWMLPMILVLVLFVMLLVFAQGSAVAPFIYTLF
ncbi:MAG: hypothetical protein HN413_17985 [Chloroflexi bacterium]|jgi:hypothetical protein|nr:hypothetical protein [Chloroflexota bacterium]